MDGLASATTVAVERRLQTFLAESDAARDIFYSNKKKIPISSTMKQKIEKSCRSHYLTAASQQPQNNKEMQISRGVAEETDALRFGQHSISHPINSLIRLRWDLKWDEAWTEGELESV